MSKLRLILLASCCVLAVAVLIPTSAAAACVNSQPASASMADNPYDSEAGLAPEVTALTVAINSSCGINFSFNIIGQPGLLSGDFVGWMLDTDNNRATGAALGSYGADYAVGMGSAGIASVLRWTGTTWSTVALAARTSEYGVSTTLDTIGASFGVPIHVIGSASWESSVTGDTFYDWVPEPGLPWFRIVPAANTSSPTPPAQPIQPAPTAPAAPTTPQPKAKRCKVPNVRGLSLAKAKKKIRKANCRVGSVHTRKTKKRYAGKAYKTSPAKGTNRAAGTRVAIYVGKRAKKKKARRASTAQSGEQALMRMNRAYGKALLQR